MTLDSAHSFRKAMPSNDATTFGQECDNDILQIASDSSLRDLSLQWIAQASRHRYSHHFTWLGLPMIQFPADIIALQEIIFRMRPDLIIETGVARGGSLIFYASMLELLGSGAVCGVEVDMRKHNLAAIQSHPLANRIRLVEGSSIDSSVVRQVQDIVAKHSRIMVVLDSNHTHDHVLAELSAYSPLVTVGQYLIVFDTIIEHLPQGYFSDRAWDVGNSPASALSEFLSHNSRFTVDAELQSKLLITAAPGGYLRCISA